MASRTALQHRPAKRQQSRRIRNRPSAIDHAVRVIYRVCCLAGSASLLDDIRADLAAEGVGPTKIQARCDAPGTVCFSIGLAPARAACCDEPATAPSSMLVF